MSKHTIHPPLATLALAAVLSIAFPSSSAWSQVAGSTTSVEASVVETTHIAAGWSVKKSLLGKTLYNEAGQKVGKVEDLIISPDRNVSYVIVGAGGFIGIGRHDVAIPVSQVQAKAGRLVMAGGTKELIQSLPGFEYARDTGGRDRFVAAADRDIALGRAKVAELETAAGTAATEAKARIDLRITALQVDVKSAEARVAELKQASAERWKEFEAGVDAATARLRKSIDAPAG